MKKNYTFIFCALILLMMGISIAGCRNKVEEAPVVVEDENDTTVVNTTYFMAINDYMTNVIGNQYSQGDVSIPCIMTVAVDESNADDILVWGDFWVYNYQVIGDLLRTVSGGGHPGLMHVRQTGNTFEVTRFEGVEDGSRYMESAKRIFGEKYNDFNRINSDGEKRETIRKDIIAQYVKEHKLPVLRYQDNGWPAINLPKK